MSKTLHSMLLTVMILGVLSVPAPAVAVDERYRVSLSFEGVEVTRQISESLDRGEYAKIKNAVDLLKPVFDHLNQEYQTGNLGERIQESVSSGDEQKIRSNVVRFLYYNVLDLLRLGHEFSREGNSSRAGVYVRKALLNYKATLQPFIENQDEKMDSIRTVSMGIQRLNQAVNSPGGYGEELKRVNDGLRELFPAVAP